MRKNKESVGSSIQVVSVGRSFLSALALRPDTTFVVKIDVEGHETSVIKELFGSKLSDRISIVFVEVSSHIGGESQGANIVALLQEQGFEMAERNGPDHHYDAVFVRIPVNHDINASLQARCGG